MFQPPLSLQGRKFTGDLQLDGRIVWQETGQVFNSPSAWATHCKKLVNPAKKSGCGWASVKYKGQKLDKYKAAWLRRHQLHMPVATADEVGSTCLPPCAVGMRLQRPWGKIESDVIQQDGLNSEAREGGRQGGASKARRASWAARRTWALILKEVGVMNTIGRGNCCRETVRGETGLRDSQSHPK